LFAWISKRAEQATAEQLDTERTIRMTGLDPEPWDAGAVTLILPDLADACADIVDWTKPLTEWRRETIVQFLLKPMSLIRKAEIARDLSGKGLTQRSSAAAGDPMTPDETEARSEAPWDETDSQTDKAIEAALSTALEDMFK